MIKKLLEMLFILVFSFSPLFGSGGQEGPGSDLAALSSGKFNAPLALIASQASMAGNRAVEAAGYKNLQLLSRHFQIGLSSEEPVVSMLVQVDDGNTRELEKSGFFVHSMVGDIAAVSGPLSRLYLLPQLPSVLKAEAARAYQPESDVSMTVTRANLVRSPIVSGGFSGQTGSNSLVAVVDTGIDIFHSDFRKMDGTTRIKALWDVSDQSFAISGGIVGSLPPMFTASGRPLGTLYTESQINNALKGISPLRSQSLDGHGNMVAGIAAGNGFATGNGQVSRQFIGMAPEADLIVIQIFENDALSQSVAFEDRLLTALSFIDQQARLLNRPVAINFSFGDHVGAHDGTSLMERAIDSLSGPGKSGRVVVKSAGNDGSRALHAGGLVGAPGSPNNTISIGVTQTGSGEIEFDFWFSGKDSLRVTMEGGGSDIADLTGLITPDSKNGDRELYFSTSRIGSFVIKIQGANIVNGRFDGWIPSRNAVFTSYVEKLGRLTLPGTARNIITVGSFNTKNSWTDVDEITHTYSTITIGALSSFSSDGPTRDGRIKPEIIAPGQRIASSLAGTLKPGQPGDPSIFARLDVLRDGVHALSQGTSFSAPHVTGLAALMMSKNPQLDASQIRRFITENGIQDDFTSFPAAAGSRTEVVPDYRWGYGKLDAYGSITTVPEPSTVRFLADIESPAPQVSVPENMTVTGWVLASYGVSTLDVLIDGAVWADSSALTFLPRPEICQTHARDLVSPDCPAVGFRIQVNHLPLGNHTLGLRIIDRKGFYNSSAAGLRPIKVDLTAIQGWIDTPAENGKVYSNFQVSGWALAARGVQQVDIFMDHEMVAIATAHMPRPDVCSVYPGRDPDCPNVGFRAMLEKIPVGNHVLTVRITNSEGLYKLISYPIEVLAPSITAAIEQPVAGANMGSHVLVSGWALSPYGVQTVELQVDGRTWSYAALRVYRPDVCAAFPGGDPNCPNVGYTASLVVLTPGVHTLTSVIRDTKGGVTTRQTEFKVAISGLLESPMPRDTVGSWFLINGWAGSASRLADIRVLLNGNAVPVTLGRVYRPDVCNAFPGLDPDCPYVGFVGLLTAPAGTYTLAVQAIDGAGNIVELPPGRQYITVSDSPPTP